MKMRDLIDSVRLSEGLEEVQIGHELVTVLVSPTKAQANVLLAQTVRHGTRGLFAHGQIVLWDAYQATHDQMMDVLGIQSGDRFFVGAFEDAILNSSKMSRAAMAWTDSGFYVLADDSAELQTCAPFLELFGKLHVRKPEMFEAAID